MKPSRRSILIFLSVLALAGLALTSTAAAGPNRHHPPRRHIVRVVHRLQHQVHHLRRQVVRIDRRIHRRHVAHRRVFAPQVITRAAEVSAVELDPVTQQFMQVTFDRGRVTAVSSGSITLEQRQNNAVWRTQAFTVPSTAVVTLNGRAVSLTQIPTGAAARIESSGAVGGTQTVVRVDAYSRGDAPLPATSSS